MNIFLFFIFSIIEACGEIYKYLVSKCIVVRFVYLEVRMRRNVYSNSLVSVSISICWLSISKCLSFIEFNNIQYYCALKNGALSYLILTIFKLRLDANFGQNILLRIGRQISNSKKLNG